MKLILQTAALLFVWIFVLAAAALLRAITPRHRRP